ncbi:MAG: AMP-binding protein [Actinophytocola sp.]|nr:AMP-binding protein [Actinophytocola sp.]MPZ81875.1 AMP-binding protein [Actinophytocola sp.]
MGAPRRPTYREARDTLLALRGQRDRAVADFEWPDVGARFNWAHDWFDRIAQDSHTPALVIADESGSHVAYTFDEMAKRSNQLARWLGGVGVKSGDPVIVMLGNQVELWETMLAIMKIGAIVVPTTTALGPEDLADRISRADVRVVVCNADDCWKFDDIDANLIRLRVGTGDGPPEGWSDIREARREASDPVEHPRRATTDPLLFYFTSGTTSKPKLVEHTNASYPVGHLTTMYWLGLRPGDVHLNISASGWAKHAWSCFFAPWIAEATIFVYNYTRFDARSMLDLLRSAEVTSFCAPPTVWRMLIKADLSSGPGTLRELAAAGEPLNPEVIEQIRAAWGLTIRDGFGQTETTALIGNTPGSEVRPGSVGHPLPGAPVVLVDPTSDTARSRLDRRRRAERPLPRSRIKELVDALRETTADIDSVSHDQQTRIP